MKISRLLAYGIVGVIADLLLKNSSLRLRRKTGREAGALKKKVCYKLSEALKPQ